MKIKEKRLETVDTVRKRTLNKKRKAPNSGITLIALIITIIVLLILAGISIVMLTGENSIIVEARWSEFLTEYEQIDELKKLYVKGEIIEEYKQSKNKFNIKSLFSSVSYATDTKKAVYPVYIDKKLPIEDTVDTLKQTICYIEGLEVEDLTDEEKVDLCEINYNLLPKIKRKREYVINNVSGMLYYIDGQYYKGKIYHTPRYGVEKEEDEEPEETIDPPVEPPVDPTENKLTIHYLPGYDGEQEYTQEVYESRSEAVTLNSVKFKKEKYKFLNWKDVTEKYLKDDDEKDDNDNENDNNEETFNKKTGGYYDIANKLITILDEGWESDIIGIIEDNKDYVPDPDDTTVAKDVKTQTINEILEYFEISKNEINAILNSGMNINNLAEWLINNKEYLIELEKYEANLEEKDEGNDEADDGTDTGEEIYNSYCNRQENVNMQGRDMYLEAVWTQNTITLNANGGKINNRSTQVIGVEEGKEYGNELKTAIRSGYVFAGWYTKSKEGEQKTKKDIYHKNDLSNDTLYAHWEKENSENIVTITFNANGATMKKNNEIVNEITEKRVKGTKIGTFPSVEKEGMMFDGWSTKKENGTMVTENTKITDNMTVYVQFYVIKLELNGGELYNTYTSTKDIENKFNKWNPVRYGGLYVQNGKKIGKQAGGRQLPYTTTGKRGIRKIRYITNPQGENKKIVSKWKGWYTGKNGTGTKIKWNSKYYNSYGRTLYANWDDRKIVTYDANGGKFGKIDLARQKYVLDGKKYPTINKPKRVGYIFLGWYDARTGGNRILLKNASYVVKNDITLYARWEKIEFKINVPSVGKTGWTQGLSITSPNGSLRGYTKKYLLSTQDPKVNPNSATTQNWSTSVSGKQEGTVYYVWAIARLSGVDIKSNNYVKVTTSHPNHYGSEISSGKCYGNGKTCTNNTYYYVIAGAGTSVNNFNSRKLGEARYCMVCNTRQGRNTYMYRAEWNTTNRTGINSRMICAKCGALADARSSGAVFVCSAHLSGWSVGTPTIRVQDKTYNYTYTCLYRGPDALGYNRIYSSEEKDADDETISHRTLYSLICNGIVTPRADSINF